jgi:hypothetical protein
MPTSPGRWVVGIETDRGLLVGVLLAAGYQVYAVYPHTVSHYRGEQHPVPWTDSWSVRSCC